MNRQTLALVFLAIVAAVVAGRFILRPQPHQRALQARELATRGLAEYLVRTHPGQRALVMSNPFIHRAGTDRKIIDTEEAGLRGLRDGFGRTITVDAVVPAELRPGALENPREVEIDPQTTTPLSFLVAPDAFDKAVQAHPDCALIVSLIGLPEELDRCAAWRAPGAPAFALLLPDLRMVGDRPAVMQAVKSGKLLAFVLHKPGGPSDDTPLGKDHLAEFEKRFVLVTPENVEQVAQEYPALF
jgi:hypothetical protein